MRWCSLLGLRRDSLAISHVSLRYLFLTLVLAGLISVLAYFFRWPSLPVPNVGTRHSVCAGVRHSFLTLVFATHFSRWYSLPIPNVGTRWPFLTLALATSTRGRKSNRTRVPAPAYDLVNHETTPALVTLKGLFKIYEVDVFFKMSKNISLKK